MHQGCEKMLWIAATVVLVVKVYREECVVPENIHIQSMEGCWKFRKEGAFKTKILKGECEAKLDFPDTWVVGW